ncbi:hypothetical protein [Cryobacterium sp. Y62]|uniref:hypothetical protein n=1 Tax=Cryobacterium sp. Y62 TaxID=2048284 RepID=UPI000CE2DE83|nr:hypothetical protein [Cryobacterium sp. Y62]
MSTWFVKPGDYVRVTEDVGDDQDPNAHGEQRVYTFYVASTGFFDDVAQQGPMDISSDGGLHFSETSPEIKLEVLKSSPVPWEQGFQIRALLNQEYFGSTFDAPGEAALLAGEVTLVPGSHAGRWVVVEYRDFLQTLRGDVLDNDEDAPYYWRDPEISLNIVLRGRISAAPTEFVYGLIEQSWSKFAEPPIGFKGDVVAYAARTDLYKLLTHVDWACLLGLDDSIDVDL